MERAKEIYDISQKRDVEVHRGIRVDRHIEFDHFRSELVGEVAAIWENVRRAEDGRPKALFVIRSKTDSYYFKSLGQIRVLHPGIRV
ncbi:hypothetical protein KW800_03260 [Candidatus Parcubacteria bacterium]|nr:hypothetical protein [Candidatus Parcubacteria bacterium]